VAGERASDCEAHIHQAHVTCRRSPQVSSTAFDAPPPDLPPVGFSFTGEREPRRRIAPKAMARSKERIREQTRRTRGISLTQMGTELATYLRGWLGYFDDGQTPSGLQTLESWLRRRLRSVVWKQWKRDGRDFANFANRVWVKTWRRKPPGVPTAGGASPTRPPWPSLCRMPTLPSSGFHPWWCGLSLIRRTAVCGPACTVVWQGRRGDPSPYRRFGTGRNSRILTAEAAKNSRRALRVRLVFA
jgi:hypothetical protein